MATIYRCDGCDREFKERRGNLVEIIVQWNTETLGDTSEQRLDFCKSCSNGLNTYIRSTLQDRTA